MFGRYRYDLAADRWDELPRTPCVSEGVFGGHVLGIVSFGDDADATIAVLTERLGPPDDDTGWIGPFNRFGTCSGNRYRATRCKSLRVEFLDGAAITAGSGCGE